MKIVLSAAFLSLLSLASTTVQAEPVALTLKLVDEAGKPLAGLGLRVATAPDTFLGAGLQTGRRLIEDGRIVGQVASTGIRPHFVEKLKASSHDVDPAVFDYLKG